MPVGLKFEKVSLHTAIDAIGKTSGLKIELAPGLEDFDISMRYSGMTAIAILRDMGRNFGFTVFEQEPGRVLLIPEVDPNQQENGKTVPPATPGSNGTTINPTSPGKTETSSGDATSKSGG